MWTKRILILIVIYVQKLLEMEKPERVFIPDRPYRFQGGGAVKR